MVRMSWLRASASRRPRIFSRDSASWRALSRTRASSSWTVVRLFLSALPPEVVVVVRVMLERRSIRGAMSDLRSPFEVPGDF
jgi:hypothetical protein